VARRCARRSRHWEWLRVRGQARADARAADLAAENDCSRVRGRALRQRALLWLWTTYRLPSRLDGVLRAELIAKATAIRQLVGCGAGR